MAEYILPQGVLIPTVEEIVAEFVADERANIDPNFDTDPDGIVGGLNGIFASKVRTAFEFLESGYHARDPDKAEAEDLDATSAITGTRRREATFGLLTGSRGPLWDLNLGDFVPSGTSLPVPGGISWQTVADFTAPADGVYRISMRASVAGYYPLPAGALSTASPPVGNSVTQDHDAVPGAVREKDPPLRRRRESELASLGGSTVAAVSADVRKLQLEDGRAPILDAYALENTTLITDVNGLPGKSFSIVVWDGPPGVQAPNDAIAQVIWDNKPAGIATYGNQVGNATDIDGRLRAVAFSRVTTVPLAISIDITTSTAYPGNPALITALLEYYVQNQHAGQEAEFDGYLAAARAVPGVKIEDFAFDALPSFTDSPCGPFEIRTLDSPDITII